MQTAFWRALEELGAGGAAACDWQRCLGPHWESCREFLADTHRPASVIFDPDHPSRRLAVEAHGEEGFLAVIEEAEVLRPPVELSAVEATVLEANWITIGYALSQSLAFAGNIWERSGPLRQIGTTQTQPSRAVLLCLPAGHLGDHGALLRGLAGRSGAVVLLPSARWSTPDLLSLARRNELTLVTLLEHFQDGGADSPLLALPAPANSPSQPRRATLPQLRVESGWTWEMLSIEVATSGRLLLSCGGRRQEIRLPKSRGSNHSEAYEILFNLAVEENPEWQNPASHEKDSETIRKRFTRLVQDLQHIVPLPGKPFRKEKNRRYVPRFAIALHRDIVQSRTR